VPMTGEAGKRAGSYIPRQSPCTVQGFPFTPWSPSNIEELDAGKVAK